MAFFYFQFRYFHISLTNRRRLAIQMNICLRHYGCFGQELMHPPCLDIFHSFDGNFFTLKSSWTFNIILGQNNPSDENETSKLKIVLEKKL